MKVEIVTRASALRFAVNQFYSMAIKGTRQPKASSPAIAVYEQLKQIDLSDTQSARVQIDLATGNPAWTKLECNHCGADVDKLIALTKHGTICLCVECLREFVKQLEEE